MKRNRLLIISLLILLSVVTLTSAFMPFGEKQNDEMQVGLIHPEAGYFENIGN